ncbi:unnamed protein product [Paramecium sonneborni]|uniref:Uncharacterized protein n=1 Tax=Paramecium sonneborni TaxID=65129 RepID=A0A8S1PB47_9CILI|nr:unnamed protein product [Paramecium sonneborni]
MLTGETHEIFFSTLYDLEERDQNDQRKDYAESKAFQGICVTNLAELNEELANLQQRDPKLQAKLDELKPTYDQKDRQRVAELSPLISYQ